MKIHRLITIAAIAALTVCSFAQGEPNGGPGGPPPGQGPGGPGGPGFGRAGLQPTEMLLRRSDVQEDLALTDDQKTKIEDILQSMRGMFGGPGGPGGPGGGPGGPPPDGAGPGGPPPDGGQGGPPPDGGPGGPPPDGGPGGPGGPAGNSDFRAKMDAARKKVSDEINAVLTADQKTRLKQIQIQLAGNAAAADAGVQKTLKLTDDQKAKIANLLKSMGEANRSVFENMRSGAIEPEDAQASLKKNAKILGVEIGKVLTSDQATALTALGGKPFKATEPERG